MDTKKEKKIDGLIPYFEYFWKCNKCGKEGIDKISARRTANSIIKAREKERKKVSA